MRSGYLFGLLFAALLSPVPLRAQNPAPGRNVLPIRGQPQEISFYPGSASGPGQHKKVLFAPGDLGMHGFAVTIAETMASWGYDVYGLETRKYLQGFTGNASLTEAEVMQDFRQIISWMNAGQPQRVILLGWSEGAGLCRLAAASDQNKDIVGGMISIGMTELNALGWHWSDLLSSLVKREPHEPEFLSLNYLPKIAPRPLMMIQSSQDEYVTLEAAQRLFAASREPKRFVRIVAKNHRFEGNHEEFFRMLREGLLWIASRQR